MLLAVLMGIDLDLLLDMLLMLVLKLLMLLDQRLDQQNRKNSPRLHYGGSVLGLSSVLGSISNVPGGSISVVIGGRTRDTWKRSVREMISTSVSGISFIPVRERERHTRRNTLF